MEIPFNKYSIEEIKYRVNNNKTITIKLRNFMFKDVIVNENDPIEETYRKCPQRKNNCTLDERTLDGLE